MAFFSRTFRQKIHFSGRPYHSADKTESVGLKYRKTLFSTVSGIFVQAVQEFRLTSQQLSIFVIKQECGMKAVQIFPTFVDAS